MKAGQSLWSEGHDASLRRLIDEGFSMSQIANKLSQAFSDRAFSRNACCGRAWRKGFTACPEVVRIKSLRNLEKARAAPRRPKPMVKQMSKPQQFICDDLTGIRSADVIPLNISLLDLTTETCHWPYGDVAPYVFCGNPVFACGPYCEPHASLAVGRGTGSERAAHRMPKSIAA